MSMDIDRVNGLLSIVKEASGHPTKLSGLVAEAMRELEGHSAEAKKEHDKFQADVTAKAAKAKADATRPQPTTRPAVETEKLEEDVGSVKRREIPAEVE